MLFKSVIDAEIDVGLEGRVGRSELALFGFEVKRGAIGLDGDLGLYLRIHHSSVVFFLIIVKI